MKRIPIGLLSGAALLLSLPAHASAGALAQLKRSVPVDTVSGPEQTALVPVKMSRVTGPVGDAAPRCFAGVPASQAPAFIDDFFSEAGVMAVTIAPAQALSPMEKPGVRRCAAASGPGSAVMCSKGMEDLPGADRKTLAEYEAARSELPAAVKVIFEDAGIRPGLILVTRQAGRFSLKLKGKTAPEGPASGTGAAVTRGEYFRGGGGGDTESEAKSNAESYAQSLCSSAGYHSCSVTGSSATQEAGKWYATAEVYGSGK